MGNGDYKEGSHIVANIVAIPLFVNLNISRYITLSVNLNALIINYAKLVMRLT